MKKNVLTLILVAFAFTLNAQNVVFSNINISLNCYSPHYVHQSTGEIVISDYTGYYIAVKKVIQLGNGSLQIFNLNKSTGEGLNYIGSSELHDVYYVNAYTAKMNVHFEIQNSNFIVGHSRTVKALFRLSKRPASWYNNWSEAAYYDETTALSLIKIKNPPVSGSSFVCSSARSYTISGIPSGATVSWEKSENLEFVGENIGRTIQVKGTSMSGSQGWVKPKVILNCGNFDCLNKTFWVGVPNKPFDIALIPPEILFHGTGSKYVDSILKTGLNKRKRHHVHLSTDKETAIKVGQRHGKPVVLEILSRKMYEDGIEFFLSENGVWLTDSVNIKYILISAGAYLKY